MRFSKLLLGLCVCCARQAGAQSLSGPVIFSRGIVNPFTLEPAPAPLAAGSPVWIDGLNLGPALPVAATGTNLPQTLGDPAVRVLVGGQPALLISISASKIVAELPATVPAGVADVVVERGGVQSRPSRILVQASAPALKSAGGLGFGTADVAQQSQSAVLRAIGVDASASVQAYVEGLTADATVTASSTRPGEFDVALTVPAAAQPGDVITLRSGSQTANRLTLGTLPSPDVRYVALPTETLDIKALTSGDLRGTFAFASGARDSSGCWPSYGLDFTAQKAVLLDGCPAAANQNANSPFVAVNEDSAVATLSGGSTVWLLPPSRTSGKYRFRRP